MYGQVPSGYAASSSYAASSALSKRRLLLPSAMTAGVLAIAVVLVAMFGLGHGGSAPSNTQMLAALHTASTGLTRAPATTFTMTVTVSAQGQQETLNMSGISSSDNREAAFKMTGPGLDESVLRVDGVGYVAVPPSAVAMNDGKPWIGLRSPTPTAEQEALESSGPAGMLKTLAGVSGTVTDEGSHTVQGVQTTEYSADVNLTSLLNATNPQLEQGLNPENISIPDAPMKIWIDRQGLARQLTLDLSFNGVSVEEVANIRPTNDLPTVSAPPASEVRMYNSISDFVASVQQAYGNNTA
jgi:hypothetical protein